MNRAVNKLVFGILLYPLYLISRIIPKSDDVWIFGAWYGNRYSDSPSYLFEYVHQDIPEIRAIWLSNKSDVISKLQSRGFNAYHMNSPKGFWYCCRANVTFVNCGYSDVNKYAVGCSFKVQIWHGIPMKKIKNDDKINQNRKYFTLFVFIKAMLLKLFPFLDEKWDLIISSSQEVTKRLSSAFSVDPSIIVETGYPRMDVILSPNKKYMESIISGKSRNNLGKIILYAPTHRREGLGGEKLFNSLDFNQFNDFLGDNYATLLIKMHYHHEMNDIPWDSLSNIKFLEENDLQDINYILPFVDVLISDYSSVIFDFLILNKPIIFAPFDLLEYIKIDRELYEEYGDTIRGIKCFNWRDVQSQLKQIFLGEDQSMDARLEMFQRFFRFSDMNNCKRIIDTVTQRLNSIT